MRKKYRKLIRDRIPEIIEKDSKRYKIRVLNDKEYRNELLKKVVEEAKEVLETSGNRKEIERVMQKRKKSRGGFNKKIFLEYIEN